MEYFELTQDREVEFPIQLKELNRKQYTYAMKEAEFEGLDRLKVTYFRESEGNEWCDIRTEPTFLVSDAVKRVLSLYDDTIRFCAIQAFEEEASMVVPLYWVPLFRMVSCLHPDTTWYPNGMLKELVLSRESLTDQPIVRVASLLEYKVVISLAAAESLLRRGFYGIGLKPVSVREGV